MFGLKQALQWHLCGAYEHWSNHDGTILLVEKLSFETISNVTY